MSRTFLAAFLLLPLLPAYASDPIGIYALIDKVSILEGTVEIEGAFAVADGRRGGFYRSPRWGTVKYGLVPGKEEQCRKEWADLAKVAGTGEVVGFGTRRPVAAAETGKPAPYPLGWGVQRLRRADYGPARMLRTFPKPLGPERIAAQKWGGTIELVARNAVDTGGGTRYVFEIESKGLGRIASPPIAPGADGKTTWKAFVRFEKGETLVWSVRAVREDLTAAVAVAQIEIA